MQHMHRVGHAVHSVHERSPIRYGSHTRHMLSDIDDQLPVKTGVPRDQ